MANYVVLESDGSVGNVVSLEAGSGWTPPAGCTIALESEYLAKRGEDKAKIAVGMVDEPVKPL